MKLKPNTIFVAAEENISFDVTSLERNKTVEGNFALMELRNTSIEREGSGERERERENTKRREAEGREVRWHIGINLRADLTVQFHKASQRRQSKTSGMSAASL